MHEGACCSGGGRGDRSLRAAGCSVRCLLANLFGVSAQNEMNFGFTPLRTPINREQAAGHYNRFRFPN